MIPASFVITPAIFNLLYKFLLFEYTPHGHMPNLVKELNFITFGRIYVHRQYGSILRVG